MNKLSSQSFAVYKKKHQFCLCSSTLGRDVFGFRFFFLWAWHNLHLKQKGGSQLNEKIIRKTACIFLAEIQQDEYN